MNWVFYIGILAVILQCDYCNYINYAEDPDVECGVSGSSARIVGGEDASPGEIPFIVAHIENGGHACGGSIINEYWTVSAAHCVVINGQLIDLDILRIATGVYDLNEPPSQSIGVTRIVVHPDYNNLTFDNDIALLHLNEQIIWDSDVAPACFPGDPSDTFEGRDGTVAGWGTTREVNGTNPDILQKATVKILSNQECKEMFAQAGINEEVMDSVMCAGYEQGGRDACQGDSGGPLFVDDVERDILVGIVSSGYGCARPSQPGKYTRLTSFTDFIEDNIYA